MASSSNTVEVPAMESVTEPPVYSFQDFQGFGNKDFEETYQQLFLLTHPVEYEQQKNGMHVQTKSIDQLIKENQRLAKKIEDMDANQTKMMQILVDMKNI
ncbi:hypothetical protein P8452_32403 [Trifolium repens]|nr:hypothetical protein P8452_32403 [Trifolium repens]